MAGGKATSHGGQVLEQVIQALTLRKFVIRPYSDGGGEQLFADAKSRWLIKNYPYHTLFGTPGRREWFLESPEWTGQLECKFQNSGGSVDEKMVYLVETLRRSDIRALALVYAGNYWSNESRGKAIVEWLQREATAIRHQYQKELLVLNMTGFFHWVKRMFP